MASTQYGSKVTLYKAVPFDNSYQNSLRAMPFADKKAWLDANYNKVEKTNVMYPRLDTSTGKGTLRLDIVDSAAEAYNYACIEDDHWHKRFCFINGCRYINDAEVTNLHISSVYEFDLELDVVMTFLLSPAQYIPAPIERHHAGEALFTNLKIAENLPVGEYIRYNYPIICPKDTNDCFGVVVYTPKLDDDGEFDGGLYMNDFMGIPNGAHFKLFDIDHASDAATSLASEIVTPSQIIAIYTVPKCIFNNPESLIPAGTYIKALDDTVSLAPKYKWAPFGSGSSYNPPQVPLDAGGTRPKNKKTNCYPYNLAKLYNDKGNYVEIRYEDWTDGFIDVEYNLTMPVSIRATVRDYNGNDSGIISATQTYAEALNYEKSVEISNYPLGSCSADSYAAFIAQNGKSMDIANIGTGVALAGALAGVLLAPTTAGASLAAVGGISAGLSTILGNASKLQNAQDAPDTTQGSVSNGNIEYRYKRKIFKVFTECIKYENAALIDSYFTKYGYAQGGLVEAPYDALRPYYVYIKTMAPCVKPINGISEPNNNQMNLLNIAFINGITLWNSTVTKDNIFDYDNLDNGNY